MQDFSCPALLRCRLPILFAFRLRGFHPLRPGFPAGSARHRGPVRRRSYNPDNAVTSSVWAPARSLATTCAITFVFSSSGYLDVSVPRVRPAPCAVPVSLPAGCPIRKSMSMRVCAPEHGLSQLVTSFFASESQGILHVPFSPFHFSYEKCLFRCPRLRAVPWRSLLRGMNCIPADYSAGRSFVCLDSVCFDLLVF